MFKVTNLSDTAQNEPVRLPVLCPPFSHLSQYMPGNGRQVMKRNTQLISTGLSMLVSCVCQSQFQSGRLRYEGTWTTSLRRPGIGLSLRRIVLSVREVTTCARNDLLKLNNLALLTAEGHELSPPSRESLMNLWCHV